MKTSACSLFGYFLFLLLIGVSTPSLSPAAQTIPVSVCEKCHGAQSGRGGAPVKPWQESIHSSNGVSCHDCHGGDPRDAANAMNPARGFLGAPKEQAIPAFCGRCHIGIRDDYLQSAHGKRVGRGGPTCVTCHGSHAVKAAVIDLINEANCGRCHPYERAGQIKTAMLQTETALINAEGKLNILTGQGIDTDSRTKALFALKNRYHRLFHEISVQRIDKEADSIKGELAKTEEWFQKVTKRQQQRKMAGAPVTGLFLVIALVCYLLKKSYD